MISIFLSKGPFGPFGLYCNIQQARAESEEEQSVTLRADTGQQVYHGHFYLRLRTRDTNKRDADFHMTWMRGERKE